MQPFIRVNFSIFSSPFDHNLLVQGQEMLGFPPFVYLLFEAAFPAWKRAQEVAGLVRMLRLLFLSDVSGTALDRVSFPGFFPVLVPGRNLRVLFQT